MEKREYIEGQLLYIAHPYGGDETNKERVQTYKEWRKEHEMELQELYKTEEERRIKKKRAGCIPKKPKWAKY